jgi:hypothetical protein
VTTQTLAPGVIYLTGGTHHSVAVEFNDYVALVEAPLNQARTLAVFNTLRGMFPNKPVKYVVNSHNHFDHLGGLRTAFHEGATIITHSSNHDFYKQEVLSHEPWTLEPDRLSLYPPTEYDEGYQFEEWTALHVERRHAESGHLLRPGQPVPRHGDGVFAQEKSSSRRTSITRRQPALRCRPMAPAAAVNLTTTSKAITRRHNDRPGAARPHRPGRNSCNSSEAELIIGLNAQGRWSVTRSIALAVSICPAPPTIEARRISSCRVDRIRFAA